MTYNGVVLVVDDDPVNIKLLIKLLGNDYEVLFSLDGKKALELAEQQQPDLILMDVSMPEMDGYQACRNLKMNVATQDIPVIFISSKNEDQDEVTGLSCGAIDYINKPINAAIVQSRVHNHLELKKARDQLKQQATIDQLTGIANRRRFDDFLLQAWRNMQREAEPLAVIMIDIDHFKLYNDFYGHAGGDDCLKRVALVMQQEISRSTDLLARYGGEEFVCILSNTDYRGCEYIAEKLRQAVENLQIPHEKSPTALYVTISVGFFVMVPSPGKLISELINGADNALYRAKENGRNQVAGNQPDSARQ